MITPKYSTVKENEYRKPIIKLLDRRYKLKGIRVLSLGGAHCLENANSIERRVLRASKKNKLVIVECDKRSVKRLLKSMTNVKTYKNAHIIRYNGEFNGQNVSVVKARLNTFLASDYSNISRQYDNMILDFYGTFNKDAEQSIKLIARHNLLNTNGSIALTSCEPGRAINTKSCKRVLRVNKDYSKGIKTIVKRTFKKRMITNSWNYKNTDVSNKALKMYVNDFQLA